MLGFILSTIVFFVAAFVLNRFLDGSGIDKTLSRRFLVGLTATVLSIGAGWATDKLDGDADSSQSNMPLSDILQGKGDTMQILKLMY